MRMKKRPLIILLFSFLLLVFQPLLSACSGSGRLNPMTPVTLTFWHVYGEQVDSPMNLLVQEFNETVGMKKGIIINVTRMSNASEIGEQLLAAQEGQPGVGSMPDLFCATPGTASLLGRRIWSTGRNCFHRKSWTPMWMHLWTRGSCKTDSASSLSANPPVSFM